MSIQRMPVVGIKFQSLTPEVRDMLAEQGSTTAHLSVLSPLAIKMAPDSCFMPLRHPLSQYFIALNGAPSTNIRSLKERSALQWFCSQYSDVPQLLNSEFVSAIGSLNFRLTGSGGGWRENTIGLNKDKLGNSIRFPDESIVSSQLEFIRAAINDIAHVNSIFTATLVMLYLTNCHPFRDGNGRTGRVLFNYVLQLGGMPDDVYIPLYEISARSHGGYHIALRQAEVHGKWEPLFEFICKMLDVHQMLQSVRPS